MSGARAVVLALVLLAPGALAALPVTLPVAHDPAAALLPVLPEPARSAPPVVHLLEPQDGVGAAGTLVLRGTALDRDSAIEDVQVRLGAAGWTSVDTATRSTPAALAWSHTLDLTAVPPGEHVVQARAFDGNAYSLPVTLRVRSGWNDAPPTVRLDTPADGDGGRPDAAVAVSGRATDPDGDVVAVRVRVDDGPWTSVGVESGAWRLVLPPLEPGLRRIEAEAVDDRDEPSVRQAVTIAVGARATPPRTDVLAPAPRTGFTESGGADCLGASPCVRLAGLARTPDRVTEVLVSVDGGPERRLTESPHGVLRALPNGGAFWSFEWPTAGAFEGLHEFRVRALAAAGDAPPEAGAPQRLEVAVSSPRGFGVLLEPAVVRTEEPFRARIAGETRIARATWSLEDGAAAEGLDVQLSVRKPGLHEVRVRAEDEEGRAGFARAVVQVLNRPPVAHLELRSERLVAGARLLVDGSTSSDPDGDVRSWRFDFGDGLVTPWVDTPIWDHAYVRKGQYLLQMSVRDDRGAVGTATSLVRVENSAPSVVASAGKLAPSTFERVRFQASATDADADALTFTWDFEDGTVAVGSSVTHAFERRGAHAVRVVAADDDGAAAEAWLQLDVRNRPPVAAFEWEPVDVTTRDVILFRDLSSKLDGRIVGWTWDFGDGSPRVQEREPYHTYAAPGSYAVRLDVLDDAGDRGFAEEVVHVGNGVPLVDFDWEPRSPTLLDDVVFTSRAGDVDGNITLLTWRVGARAVDGETFVHRFTEKGPVNVTLTAVDDVGARASLTRVLHVMNARPVLTIPEVLHAHAGEAVVLQGSAVDPDGRIVELRWDVDGDGVDDFAGTASSVRWTYELPGRYQVTFRAVDDDGEATARSLLVLVDLAPPSNEPPTVVILTPREGDRTTGTLQIEGAATDDRGIRRVEWQVRKDGVPVLPSSGEWYVASGGSSWGAELDTRLLGVGGFELVARAWDGETWSDLSRRTILVDNDPQETTSIALQVLRPGPLETMTGLVTAQGTSYHPYGVSRVLVALDENAFVEAVGAMSWSHEFDTRNVTSGLHTLRVRAYHGEVLYREERVRFQVNNDPPTLYVYDNALRGPLAGEIVVTGHVKVDRPAERIFVRIDDAPALSFPASPKWTWTFDTTRLPDGNHTVSFWALGVDGLWSEPLVYRARVVNSPPEVEAPSDPEEPARETPLAALVALGAVAAAALSRRRRP